MVAVALYATDLADTIEPRPSGYAISIVAIGAAWLCTKIIGGLIAGWRESRELTQRSKSDADQSLDPPIHGDVPQLGDSLGQVRIGEKPGKFLPRPPQR
jgi:hypothetical protein